MEVAREIKMVRASLDTIRSSITNLHSSELQYLAKEVESELVVLNNIEQWLNTPNATEDELKKALSGVQKTSFTLVLDNRENLRQLDLSALEKQQPAHRPGDPKSTHQGKDSESSDDISANQTTNLIEDPLQELPL